jgi:rhodanese-related sulfurtransferase
MSVQRQNTGSVTFHSQQVGFLSPSSSPIQTMMIDVPLNRLVANPKEFLPPNEGTPTYVVCRLGNDSQIAVDSLRSVCAPHASELVKDVLGGLRAWSKEIDPAFPVY